MNKNWIDLFKYILILNNKVIRKSRLKLVKLYSLQLKIINAKRKKILLINFFYIIKF